MEIDFAAKASAIKSEIQKLFGAGSSELHSLRKDLAKDEARFVELETLPIPREEFVANMERAIDEIADTYLPSLSRATQMFLRHPLRDFSGVVAGDRYSRAPFLTAPPKHADTANFRSLEAALFYLLKPEMKAAARKAISEMEYPAAGPKMDDRRAEMATLTARIASLKSKIYAIEHALKIALRGEETE